MRQPFTSCFLEVWGVYPWGYNSVETDFSLLKNDLLFFHASLGAFLCKEFSKWMFNWEVDSLPCLNRQSCAPSTCGLLGFMHFHYSCRLEELPDREPELDQGQQSIQRGRLCLSWTELFSFPFFFPSRNNLIWRQW